VIPPSNVPFAAAHSQAWQCYAIIRANTKNKHGIAIIAALITSATLITTVKIALILKYLDLFLK